MAEKSTPSFIDYYGCDVFDDEEMKKRLSPAVYGKFRKTIEEGDELDAGTADEIACAMKDWAVEHGATHYSHWFQPLNGVTAEKHESFLNINEAGEAILRLSGKHLIKGESDASSFPSGGLRATFEARGYTTWDCTSPAFLREDALGVTLCIPTAFCAYTGEALDKKTPLLRSVQAIDEEGVRLLRALGNETSRHVIPMVGAEQEYFLVDKELHDLREDLVYTGHTLFGAMPPKGQEMDDYYFGAIEERIGAYMADVNRELWKLGVPAKTQHNEAAPAQHELAPLYEQCNIATDHNQMMMETMKKVAVRHGLVCLLHEKPFAGVNGSGKHNNWSLTTDDGIDLFKPGKAPHENIRFLVMLACVIRAVDRHADLLRQSAAVVGNDLRLGANEAPPAVVSIYLGDQLEDIIDQFCRTGAATSSKKGGKFSTGVNSLPNFNRDTSDRNRTSPFAFTGNKFEFRMVGSSASVSSPNVVLNTIVAESFQEAVKVLEKAKDKEEAARTLIRDIVTEHRRIIFNGNGYSKEWLEEAERRGLPNLPSMVDAIPALTTPKAVKLFERFGVFTKAELLSRAEIEFESYAKEINVEARTMLDMAGTQIIPAVAEYIGKLAEALGEVKEACPRADVSVQRNLVMRCSTLLAKTKKAADALEKEVAQASALKNAKNAARRYHDRVVPAMEALRAPVDKLELLVDASAWPMPRYGELMA